MGTWVIEFARNDGFDAAPTVVAVAGNPIVDFGGDNPVALCEYNGGIWLGDVPDGAFLEGGDCWQEVAVDVAPVVGGGDQQPWIW